MEQWKTIKEFENYEVSTEGRIKRKASFKFGKIYEAKIMKHRYHNGYQIINLFKNKKTETFSVHSLVAKTFLENPENKKTINHKDGIKTNNFVENLEWATHKENNKHAIENKLLVPNLKGILELNKKLQKKVAILKDNKIILIADSSRELAGILLEQKIIKDVKLETLSRGIRRFANNGLKYHSFNFQFI
jgi:hypothetical protein